MKPATAAMISGGGNQRVERPCEESLPRPKGVPRLIIHTEAKFELFLMPAFSEVGDYGWDQSEVEKGDTYP